MAGNERAGLDGADPGLFEGRPWVILPVRRSDRRGGAVLEELVRGMGARPRWMTDPRAHDLAVARVSHVPYLIAYALTESAGEALRVCGNSFRDATRVAASDVDMVLDFLLTNRRAIRRAGREFLAGLERLLGALEAGDERALRKALRTARRRRSGI
jgi:prephenate dehydrogenase